MKEQAMAALGKLRLINDKGYIMQVNCLKSLILTAGQVLNCLSTKIYYAYRLSRDLKLVVFGGTLYIKGYVVHCCLK